ncbi:DUF4097 family beta strand repeat-containing protein [Gemmatimonas groenlandica]|uniref:DUF4097 family beta strand repeat protein n=1 Tax=Gemmatimonas groenlandica TaxID=2732249 RepID=A0A6M4IIU5_9BACT|nr:DUF4097 family beta strand repeat-containing protein [Gemmatimonas groenlandica]QJR34550.1 DUF4097 family beta strand repeat protein [Gemmatimonas groenlandica]
MSPMLIASSSSARSTSRATGFGRRLSASITVWMLVPAALTAQTERRTLSGSQVALYNVAGEVRIVRGDRRDVQFEITMRGRDASRLRIEAGTVRGLPTLRVIYPDDDVVYRGGPERRWGGSTETRIRDDGTWGGDGWRDRDGQRVRVKTSGSGLEAWADIRVLVPDGTALDSYLLVGEMSATDVDADLRLDVASARVAATDTRGTLIIDAGSGGVSLRGTRGRRVSVDNGSGSVSLDRVSSDECTVDTGSGGVTATELSCKRLSVDVGSGSVRLGSVSANDVSVDAGSGGVSIDMVSSPSSVSVDAGSGGVTLALPENFGADVDIETGSGSITTDFAVRTRTLERRHLRGTIGNGAGRVVVETGSGSVRLRRSTM